MNTMEGGRVREAVCGSLNLKAPWREAFFLQGKTNNKKKMADRSREDLRSVSDDNGRLRFWHATSHRFEPSPRSASQI